jgi:hypothetical protein
LVRGFLSCSRHQELQRTGRLMHAEHPERHGMIMIEGEMQKYGRRLWALQEQGSAARLRFSFPVRLFNR